jgi:hypothetical protein
MTMHNLDAYQQTEKIIKLHQMRRSVVFYRQCLKYSDNPKEIEAAKQGYQYLLDSFYSEVSDYIPLQQYHAAGKDIEYFIRLIDLALAYFVHGMEAEGQVQ